MKRLIPVIAVAVTVAACGGKNDQPITASDIRLAMPSKEVIQIGTPKGGSSSQVSSSQALTAADLEKDGSKLFGITILLAAGINGGTWWTLFVLENVVHLPPTHCTADTCTWGPGSGVFDVNVFKLVVTRDGDHFDYVLSAEPKSRPGSGFVDYLTGTAYPGAAPHRGYGSFTVDFDRVATLDHAAGWHQNDWGQVTVTYDNRTTLSIGATFLDAKNAPEPGDPSSPGYPNRANAAYAFLATDSGGDLQVAWRTLPPATEKTMTLHSRWTATGSGRGDERAVEAAVTSTWSQCWLGNTEWFQLAYDSLDPEYPNEEACSPFDTADYGTLTAP